MNIAPGSFLLAALLVSAAPLGVRAEALSPLGKEAAAYLSDLVRINTVNPPGNERAACDYMAGVLRLSGIPFTVYESTPGRANIVARLKGTGERRPILLLSHLDTVGVEDGQWTFSPFSGEIKDGYLHGRGAIDDKSMAAAFLAAILKLKRDGIKLKRDVIFAATADEESGARYGVRWLAEHAPETLNAQYALSEGGSTYREGDGVRLIAVQTLEKAYYDIRLIARGMSGHASVPLPHNTLFMLGRSLARISTWERPMRLNEVTRAYLDGIAEFETGQTRRDIEDILSDEPQRVARGEDALRGHPYYAALMQDTIVPTMAAGGIRENVVPSEAQLNLNVRLLPDSDSEEFLGELGRVIAEPGVEISVHNRPDGPSAPAMPVEGGVYEAMVRAAARLAPRARVVPAMSVGSTDAEFLRQRGVLVYGMQFPLSVEEEARIHGHDERIPLSGLDFGVRYIVEILREAAL